MDEHFPKDIVTLSQGTLIFQLQRHEQGAQHTTGLGPRISPLDRDPTEECKEKHLGSSLPDLCAGLTSPQATLGYSDYLKIGASIVVGIWLGFNLPEKPSLESEIRST
jgi:hypothetical protein